MQVVADRRGGPVLQDVQQPKNVPRDYEGEIDVFGVYSPVRNLVYLVPAAGLPTRCCSLRLAPARNGQEKRVWWAHDFLLGPP